MCVAHASVNLCSRRGKRCVLVGCFLSACVPRIPQAAPASSPAPLTRQPPAHARVSYTRAQPLQIHTVTHVSSSPSNTSCLIELEFVLKTGWGGGRTRSSSPMKPVPRRPPRSLPPGAFFAPPPPSPHRPVPRPALAPAPQGSPPSRPGAAAAGPRERGARRDVGGRTERLGRAGGGRPGGRREEGGGRRAGAGRRREPGRAASGVLSPWQCWAQPEVRRPRPCPPWSPPLFPRRLLSPSGRPLLPSHLLFLPWRPRWVARRREEPPDLSPLYPEGRGTPFRPGVPRTPSHLPLISLRPSAPLSVLHILPASLPLRVPSSFFLSPPSGPGWVWMGRGPRLEGRWGALLTDSLHLPLAGHCHGN